MARLQESTREKRLWKSCLQAFSPALLLLLLALRGPAELPLPLRFSRRFAPHALTAPVTFGHCKISSILLKRLKTLVSAQAGKCGYWGRKPTKQQVFLQIEGKTSLKTQATRRQHRRCLQPLCGANSSLPAPHLSSFRGWYMPSMEKGVSASGKSSLTV